MFSHNGRRAERLCLYVDELTVASTEFCFGNASGRASGMWKKKIVTWIVEMGFFFSSSLQKACRWAQSVNFNLFFLNILALIIHNWRAHKITTCFRLSFTWKISFKICNEIFYSILNFHVMQLKTNSQSELRPAAWHCHNDHKISFNDVRIYIFRDLIGSWNVCSL